MTDVIQTAIKPTLAPCCGALVDHMTSTSGQPLPNLGDFVICTVCGGVNQHTALGQRHIPDDELRRRANLHEAPFPWLMHASFYTRRVIKEAAALRPPAPGGRA